MLRRGPQTEPLKGIERFKVQVEKDNTANESEIL